MGADYQFVEDLTRMKEKIGKGRVGWKSLIEIGESNIGVSKKLLVKVTSALFPSILFVFYSL